MIIMHKCKIFKMEGNITEESILEIYCQCSDFPAVFKISLKHPYKNVLKSFSELKIYKSSTPFIETLKHTKTDIGQTNQCSSHIKNGTYVKANQFIVENKFEVQIYKVSFFGRGNYNPYKTFIVKK